MKLALLKQALPWPQWKVRLIALLNWLYMTVRCPSLWDNPIQWIMAWNSAAQGMVAWRINTPRIVERGRNET